MKDLNDDLTQKDLKERFKKILFQIGLTVPGASVFFDVTPQYIYAILRGNKTFTEKFAGKIEKRLSFQKGILFRLDSPIPKDIKSAKEVIKFEKSFAKPYPNYFIDKKRSDFIENSLLAKGYFTTSKSVKEVREQCKNLGEDYTSDELTKTLIYYAILGKLNSRKEPIVLQDGSNGKRMVNVYWQK